MQLEHKLELNLLHTRPTKYVTIPRTTVFLVHSWTVTDARNMEEEIISIASKDPTDSVPSQAETLSTSPSYLVQALVADKEALSALTTSITSALAPLIQKPCCSRLEQRLWESRSACGSSGVETHQSKTAQVSVDLVATQNNAKRTFAKTFGVSGDLVSNKRLRDSSSTEECEETSYIFCHLIRARKPAGA